MSDPFDLGNLMQGFAGNLLGALVTIAIPVIGHYYARWVARRSDPTVPLPYVAGTIARFLNSFEVTEARRFSVKLDRAYTHPQLDFQVGFGSTPRSEKVFSSLDPYINLTLPGSAKPERIEKLEAGWTRLFEHKGVLYRLTLVARDPMELAFELRALLNGVPER